MNRKHRQSMPVLETLEERVLLSSGLLQGTQMVLASATDYNNSNPPSSGYFRDLAGASNINYGTDYYADRRAALNFNTGRYGTSGLTLYDDTPSTSTGTLFAGSINLAVDVIQSGPNVNAPGLVALFNEGTGKRGLALVVAEAGTYDTLGLYTVGQDGKLATANRLAVINLNRGICDNTWYYLTMDVTVDGDGFAVTGKVFNHWNPEGAVGAQVGSTLTYAGSLSARGLQSGGEIGVIFGAGHSTGKGAARKLTVSSGTQTTTTQPTPEPTPEPTPTPTPEPTPTPAPAPTASYTPGSVVTAQAVSTANGFQFVVIGTNGNDVITVSQAAASMTLILATGSTSFSGVFTSVLVYSFSGDDVVRLASTVSASSVIYGGDGNDQLFEAGSGSAVVHGEAGNDLLVTVGGGADQIYGEGDFDSFWLDGADVVKDASTTETASKTVHRIGAFYQATSTPVSLEIAGQNIVDPVAAIGYLNYASSSLFTNGPNYSDVIQGSVADCYFLASLSAVAMSDPEIIRQMIAPMGDGTYAVRFFRNGQEVYVRVDADLPSYGGTSLLYARLSPTGETWVALAEKAYAQLRYGQNSYASLGWGSMDTVLREVTNVSASWVATSGTPDAVGQYIVNQVAAGHPVTAGTSSHAYAVVSAQQVNGQWTVTTYNPWGYLQSFTMADFQSQFTTFITGAA